MNTTYQVKVKLETPSNLSYKQKKIVKREENSALF